MQPFGRTMQVFTFEQEVLAPLRFEFFDDRRSGCYGSDAGCFLEALFVLRVGNFLTSWTSCADARHDAL